MQEFLTIVLSLPTVVYTVMLGLVLVYWLTVIAGAIDLDIFDIDADIDADIDLDLDLDADIDLDADADVDVGDGAGAFATVLSALGLVGVPFTITLSIFTLANWATCFLATYFLSDGGREPVGVGVALGILAASFVGALLTTSLTVRPLRPIFRAKLAPKAGDSFVGLCVRVTSGEVTAAHGRGELEIEDQAVLVAIRCDSGARLGRGEEALIVSYDAERHVYQVEPLSVVLASDEEMRTQNAAVQPSERAS